MVLIHTRFALAFIATLLCPSPCHQMVVSRTSLASGTQGPLKTELYSLGHNNEPKSHLQSPDAKESHLLTNKALNTDAVVAFAHRKGILGPKGLLSCTYLNDHVRLWKRDYSKCPMPVLFIPPEFAYQSLPDPELSYTFLRLWHPAGVQTGVHLLKTFIPALFPYPEFNLSISWCKRPINIGQLAVYFLSCFTF